MDINIYKYILTRQDVPEPMWSVRKLLAAYGYDNYVKIACDRIADSDLIDGEHVQIDFTNCSDLLLDYSGIIKCEDILSGYISDMDVLKEYSDSEHEIVINYNTQLAILKNSSMKNLFKALYEIAKSDSEEFKQHYSWFGRMFFMEIISRSPINFLIQRVREILLNGYCRIRYANVLLVLKNAKEITE